MLELGSELGFSMERTDSSTGAPQLNLPPGFRFHPTDEELVVHYLEKKASSSPLPVAIIAEVELYKFDPWELPAKAAFGEQEWYFFSPRDRKYPNGARPNRAAVSGYWKATGTDKPILASGGGDRKVGVKKALVFYGGKPPKGIKTNWIMHEYRLIENKLGNKPPGCDYGHKKNSRRLDDWVLCRIYKKSNWNQPPNHGEDSMDELIGNLPPTMKLHLPKMASSCFGSLDRQFLDGGPTTVSAGGHLFPVGNSLPLERNLPSLFWNEEEDQSNKKTEQESNDESLATTTGNCSNHSSSALLNPPPPVLSSFSDHGTFRPPYQHLPGMIWYS